MDFAKVKIADIKANIKISADADLIIEEPLLIIVDGRETVTIMRTPGSDKELALGFLFSEGLINSTDDIKMIDVRSGEALDPANTVNITLKSSVRFAPSERSYEVRSSCGICGQKKIDELFSDISTVKNVFKIRYADIVKMPDIMAAAQRLSKLTRGAHAAAIFTKDAKMIACFEDVGRHNALDKLIGHCLISGIEMSDKILLLSGRSSYEMLAKALRCSIPFVVSVSAPSSLAVEVAKRGNIALAGILRGDTMKVYTRHDDFIE